jgi:hydroxyacylglutathione hydrolase
MDGSTVVISPPDGHMASYMQSLYLLFDYPISVIAPAHGDLIADAQGEIKKTIQHRLTRENKVLRSLCGDFGHSVANLTPLVYDDVPAFMHPIAQQSLYAHLLKLAEDGRVRDEKGQWIKITE